MNIDNDACPSIEADSIPFSVLAGMRQQFILGCSSYLLKGRYRISNSPGWLDTMYSSDVSRPNSKQVKLSTASEGSPPLYMSPESELKT